MPQKGKIFAPMDDDRPCPSSNISMDFFSYKLFGYLPISKLYQKKREIKILFSLGMNEKRWRPVKEPSERKYPNSGYNKYTYYYLVNNKDMGFDKGYKLILQGCKLETFGIVIFIHIHYSYITVRIYIHPFIYFFFISANYHL